MAESSASKGFVFCVKNVALLVLFAPSLFKVSEGWCNDCEDDQVCCNSVCIYASSCLGVSCTTGSYTDCSFGGSCCNNVCVNGSNCLGQTCSYSAECGVAETCCSGKCTSGYDCSGQPCWTNDDCGSINIYCCEGTCGFYDCNPDNTLWVVVGLIFGSVLVIIGISIFVRCIYRRGLRPAYGSVVVGQRVVPATSAPYLGQSPPSYQQGYPYYPPPQYEQYPAYNEGTTKSSEPPPPYSTAPEGRSEGVSATQNNYGAVQNSSLPV